MEGKSKENGLVVRVIDYYKLAINLGQRDDINIGDKFLVYYLSKEDIIDPDRKSVV